MKSEIKYVYEKLKQLRFDFKESDKKLFPNEYTFDYSLNRYIRVDGNDLFISKDTFKPLEEELEYADKCHNLEQQLGCPLEVLFRALRDGIFISDEDFLPHSCLLRNDFILVLFDDIYKAEYLLKEYKKTWWLKPDKSE